MPQPRFKAQLATKRKIAKTAAAKESEKPGMMAKPSGDSLKKQGDKLREAYS
jgi:hypothetical protein